MAASAGRVLLIPKGTYNAATTYNMLDVVYYNGGSYVCKQTSLNNLPTDTDYWQLLVSSSGTAAQVSFDPTGTDMVSTNVQNAVVEVKNNISNPNLLINPWFTVNQRGQNTYTRSSTDIYTVDRWKCRYGTGSVAVSDSGITLTTTSSGSRLMFYQQFDAFTVPVGTTCTLSIKLQNGTILSGTFSLPAFGGSSVDAISFGTDCTVRFIASASGIPQYGVAIYAGYNESIALRAVKLEIGTISTLALDTAPDYTTELLKCQRYFRQINGNNDAIAIGVSQISNCLFIINSVPMRVSNPTVTATGTWKVSVLGTDYSTTSIFRTGSTSTSGIIQIAANYSGSSSHAGQSANLFSSGSASIQIDAEL